jgi:uncharacterized protein
MYEDMYFEWDENKNALNIIKHGMSFETAREAFLDPDRVTINDDKHSAKEKRYFAFGMVNGAVLTVRYTRRGKTIRIFGAGYWRQGTERYYEEQKNCLH